MAIDIRNLPEKSAPTAPTSGKQATPTGTSAAQARGTQTDSVSLTEAAYTMKRAEQSLETVPTVNGERVAKLARAIADGEYRVDAERIAAKLLQFEGELAGRGAPR